MAKTFDDFVLMSVICFAQDNLKSNYTPRYEWLATLESGVQIVNTGVCWVFFLIGRCTLFDILNCICHLSDHFSS